MDLVGTAIFLEEFGRVIAPGGAGLVISSMAGHMLPVLEPAQDQALAQTAADELLQLPMLSAEAIPNSGAAYAIAKRANLFASRQPPSPGVSRDARVNSISPGIILTPLAHDEMSGPGAENYRRMIETSAARRVGTTEEVASVAAFLIGPTQASSPAPTCSSTAASSPHSVLVGGR